MVSLVHEGQLIQNNSLISLEAFTNSLYCITNNPMCCDTSSGNWFPPRDDDPVSTSPNSTTFYHFWRNNQSIELSILNDSAGIVDDGLYRCEILDKENVTQTLYVGIYSSTEGS